MIINMHLKSIWGSEVGIWMRKYPTFKRKENPDFQWIDFHRKKLYILLIFRNTLAW